jgi:ABC-type multidrug transport system ATPase subunit
VGSSETKMNISLPCKLEYTHKNIKDLNFYTIAYDITKSPNGFLDKFNLPLPTDSRLVRLKTVIDNAYIEYYHSLKYGESQPTPYINVTTLAFPSAGSRLSKNANSSAFFGVFYLFFPPMICFCIFLIELVKEKESLLKSYINLYGLSLQAYWINKIIIAIINSTIVSLELLLIGKYYFRFDFFDNVNMIVIFLLFFLFTLSMQHFAMLISCILKSGRAATTVSYGVILVGIVIQCIFTNYGVIYSFYGTNVNNRWVDLIRLLFHFYPPFLFSKGFLDITRICTFHFDSPSLQWIEGRYFAFMDLFYNQEGKLRIGIEYKVDSLFTTYVWFLFLILLYTLFVVFYELKESLKYDQHAHQEGVEHHNDGKQNVIVKRGNPFFNLGCKVPILSYFLSNYKIFKDSISLKHINIKKQSMENNINRDFEKFLKNEEKKMKCQNGIDNPSFCLEESHISVVREKTEVAKLNKRRAVPSGIRIMCVGKTYQNNLKALSDVNIEITKNELITILGPNGAGKSTLINILTSQIASTNGYAKVGPFTIHSELFLDAIYVKRLIGICSQFDYLWEDLTVSETLILYSRLRGIKETRISTYVDEKIVSVGLEKKKNELVSKLSGGMRRRLSICIATLGEPLIIIMDEPTTGLDPNNRRKIWKLINSIKKNRVIILTTHMLDEAEYLSDRLGIIINGKLRFIGNCTELRETQWSGIILTLSNIILILF